MKSKEMKKLIHDSMLVIENSFDSKEEVKQVVSCLLAVGTEISYGELRKIL